MANKSESILKGTVDQQLRDEPGTAKAVKGTPAIQTTSWNAGDTAGAMNTGDRNQLHKGAGSRKGHEAALREHKVVHSPEGNDFSHPYKKPGRD